MGGKSLHWRPLGFSEMMLVAICLQQRKLESKAEDDAEDAVSRLGSQVSGSHDKARRQTDRLGQACLDLGYLGEQYLLQPLQGKEVRLVQELLNGTERMQTRPTDRLFWHVLPLRWIENILTKQCPYLVSPQVGA